MLTVLNPVPSAVQVTGSSFTVPSHNGILAPGTLQPTPIISGPQMLATLPQSAQSFSYQPLAQLPCASYAGTPLPGTMLPLSATTLPQSIPTPLGFPGVPQPIPMPPPPKPDVDEQARSQQQKQSDAEEFRKRYEQEKEMLANAGFAEELRLPPANQDPRGDYLENLKLVGEREPWLDTACCAERSGRYGLDSDPLRAFCKSCEFISLGSHCGPARTLQALDLRGASYPFDWTRSPVEGVMHCFQTQFTDLCETEGTRVVEKEVGSYIIGMKWGGSCLHHDPDVPKTREDFNRRAKRLLGNGQVSASQTRVFIRAVNSTDELGQSLALLGTLKRTYPGAMCYLLVIVDMQRWKGPVQPAYSDLMHYFISQDLYNGSTPYSMERHCEAYAEALAFAIRAWSGDAAAWKRVHEAPQMSAVCQRFTAGDPFKELFKPVLC